jgi:hypothetical protein
MMSSTLHPLELWRDIMKKWLLIPLAVAVFMPVAAAAQSPAADSGAQVDPSQTRKAPHKAVTISGRISVDGKFLVSDKDEIWTIANPNVLVGHEGQQVLVKCQLHPDKNEIHVFFLKQGLEEAKYVSRGDAAFRR